MTYQLTHQSYLSQIATGKQQRWLRRSVSLFLGIALFLSTSCARQPDLSESESPNSGILTLQAQASSRPGSYVVDGRADLPDSTRVTISAVRFLRPGDQQPVYSILDRQIAEVLNGQWQVTLNLWQVAADGRYQEAWQLQQDELGAALGLGTEVTFVSTVDLDSQQPDLREELRQRFEGLEGSLIQVTSEGRQYLQATQARAMDLPSGQTDLPPSHPDDGNLGWGDRYLLGADTPQTTTSNIPDATSDTTDAPLSASELLR